MASPELSRRFVDVIPKAMQSIREEIRSTAAPEFTVPQFRVMAYLGRHRQATNNELAAHVGVTAPTMSRIVDALVHKRLLLREVGSLDRRELRITLSPRGLAKYEALRDATKLRFQDRFQSLDERQQSVLNEALGLLEGLLK